MGKVIFAFPGTGKTHFCKNNNNCIELSSEDFHWENINKSENSKGTYKQLNKEWPNNYLNAIIEAKNKYDFVFITHSASLLCQQENIHYDLIYPSIECKEEYIKRMIDRGNNIEFINNMQKNYEAYITECIEDNYADEKIELQRNEFLEDGIKKLNKLNICPLLDNYDSLENLVTTINSANVFRENTKIICQNKNVDYVLILFDNQFIESLINMNVGMEVGRFYSGSDYNKIVLIDNYLVTSSFLGGPNASALMEELAYYGIKYFLAVGTACNLNQDNKYDCMVIEKSIRDEGTSLFYKEPSLYAYTNKILSNMLCEELNCFNLNYYKGISWTIDAYYRENKERMLRRIEQGATCIEMESSVWSSVAENLNLSFSEIVFFSDKIKKNIWNKNVSNTEIKNYTSNLGLDISKKLIKKLRR